MQRTAHLSRFLIVPCSIVLLATLAGCDKADAPKAKDAAPAAPSGASAAKKAYPIYKITPEQFLQEFKADQPAMIEKYNHGMVELAGPIETIGLLVIGEAAIELRAGPRKPATANGPAETPVVQCLMTEGEPWSKLAPGQEVTVRGHVSHLPFASLEQCEVVTAGPPTAITVPADQLAKEYAANRKAFGEKYAAKSFIVTGKVLEKKAALSGAITLFIEGDGATRIRCDFGMIQSTVRKTVSDIQVGQVVKLYGEFHADNGEGSAVPLNSCAPITR